jgi:hypothetical protein
MLTGPTLTVAVNVPCSRLTTMTMDELRTWNESGCVWRCLKKLANETGNTITKEQFLAQFDNLPGEFDAASLGPILRQLGLPERSQISDNYSVIEGDFNATQRRILVMSQINLNPGHTDVVKHCSVLTQINEESFSVWTPCQDGKDTDLSLKRNDWEAKKCFGLAIF